MWEEEPQYRWTLLIVDTNYRGINVGGNYKINLWRDKHMLIANSEEKYKRLKELWLGQTIDIWDIGW